ncbi:MAG: EamA family transporter RarD [Bacteroidales bacterium]|nr:EamA family transporter RarD [Bacteroidales bacterium]
MQPNYRKGLVYGILSYSIWGLFPLYWHLLRHVDSLEILANRMLWSLVAMALFFFVVRRQRLRTYIHTARQWLLLLVTASLNAFNWGLYIWAVNNGQLLQSSLGYYINPLINILLGHLFLHERLTLPGRIALVLALLGVSYFTVSYGNLPLISLALATSFAVYGLLKKKMELDATPALTVETFWMAPPAAAFIIYLVVSGQSTLCTFHLPTALLLMGAGVVTAVPLLLFGKAANNISLSTLGFLQYISPTGQFLIGVLLFHEDFTPAHIVCFTLIWTGLIIYTIAELRRLSPKPNHQSIKP